jgi:hypothetical protein
MYITHTHTHTHTHKHTQTHTHTHIHTHTHTHTHTHAHSHARAHTHTGQQFARSAGGRKRKLGRRRPSAQQSASVLRAYRTKTRKCSYILALATFIQ